MPESRAFFYWSILTGRFQSTPPRCHPGSLGSSQSPDSGPGSSRKSSYRSKGAIFLRLHRRWIPDDSAQKACHCLYTRLPFSKGSPHRGEGFWPAYCWPKSLSSRSSIHSIPLSNWASFVFYSKKLPHQPVNDMPAPPAP